MEMAMEVLFVFHLVNVDWVGDSSVASVVRDR